MPIPSCEAYTTGAYFADPARHSEDAEFKAREFLKLLTANRALQIESLADVGCGSGGATIALVSVIQQAGYHLTYAAGYDVSPHIKNLRHPFIRFVHEDFTDSNELVDLVTLFDVVEHVPDPITFLKQVASRTRLVGLHIPLEASLYAGLRGVHLKHLKDPGHLIVLDVEGALNLLAFAGLRVIDFRYTRSFTVPGFRPGLLGKLAFPFRTLGCALSPWLVSKTLGCMSLMVLARTPAEQTHLSGS